MDRPGGLTQTWDGYRLSRQQEHLLDAIGGRGAARTVAGVRVAGPVDVAVLDLAVRDVVAVHESLRTTYRKVLGENSAVLMVIEDEPRVAVVEAEGDDAALRDAVQAELTAESAESADDELRLVLFAHDGEPPRHSLVVSAPRLSLDDLSAEVFFQDLWQAYVARLAGASWTRDDVVQYADYAQWQDEQDAATGRQQDAAGARQAVLADLPPLHLPLELNATSTEQDVLEWTVPTPVATALRAAADGVGTGLRGVLLTGWIAALWHAAGRPDQLSVSATLARRPFAEMRTSIGHYESQAPVVAAIGDQTTLADLLGTVDHELDSLDHADEGALSLVSAQSGRAPGFRFRDSDGFAETRQPTWSGVWVEQSDLASRVSLSVRAVHGGDLHLTLNNAHGAMADGGAQALAECLRAVLRGLAGDRSGAVSALPVLADDAARALVAATNPVDPPTSTPAPWHRQFERVAAEHPDATALLAARRQWTYAELDAAANRLANELLDRGVTPGGLVGLHLERSDVAVVAVLAIAKAGAGYVPLDPGLPPKRRAAILAGAELTHVVTDHDGAGLLPSHCQVTVLDADLTGCAGRSDQRPDVPTPDGAPAYVLFTSGSTGEPKGVVVGHPQLAAYLDGVLHRLELSGPVDAVSLGTLGTDLGNTALFPPLLTGGRLQVISPEVSADAQELATVLAGSEYDLMKITPSHLAALFAVAESPEALMPRQALVVGGEPFGWGWYSLFRGFLGDTRLYNHYGPTETTVGVLCGQATSNELATLASTVPLGTPMRHARAYVLDPQRRPLPAGIAGELWIGGAGVSQGYLAPTGEERFVADPFGTTDDARMYRTGDRARLLPDGTVEFLGRMDRQIKVRGFRVELGEIESVMRQHPRVSAAVTVESGESTAVRIVGYLVDTEGTRGPAEWLREFLTERLPEFMVPAHLVALDAFPVTSSGKVDSSMLPEPDLYNQEATTYVEPRTDTERRVAGVMAALLLRNRVGADDDFFGIGGHSLLAAQLVARLRDEFAVRVKLRNLFEHPVVSELAAFLDEQLDKKQGGA